jgi:thiol-disulfide isomerase/thioredoxin
MSTVSGESTDTKRRNIFVLLPLLAFLALAALFLYRLGAGDPSHLPSALIGHPAPKTDLPPLAGLERDGKQVPGLSNATFTGAVTLVNVWASWCIPCRDEVPLLERLSKDKRIQVAGINYKDAAAALIGLEPDIDRLVGHFGVGREREPGGGPGRVTALEPMHRGFHQCARFVDGEAGE